MLLLVWVTVSDRSLCRRCDIDCCHYERETWRCHGPVAKSEILMRKEAAATDIIFNNTQIAAEHSPTTLCDHLCMTQRMLLWPCR